MAIASTRQSDRVSFELLIEVMGTDATGKDFMEKAKTLVVSRHGAKILMTHQLVPEQEITIHCVTTGKEADARVVGLMGSSPRGYSYGVHFLDPIVNIWDIEFPPTIKSEEAVGRVLLECAHCRSREVAYLDEFEAEIFHATRMLSRPCKGCSENSFWHQAPDEGAGEPAPTPPKVEPAAPALPKAPENLRTKNERSVVRICLPLTACIRRPQSLDELVVTENVSRGGFSFKSKGIYSEGMVFEVAVPYERGGANIFIRARIENVRDVAIEGVTLYGVSYVHPQTPGHKTNPHLNDLADKGV